MFNLVSDVDSSASPPTDCEAPDSDSAVLCRSSNTQQQQALHASARANSWPNFSVNVQPEDNEATKWINDKQLASNSRISACRQRFVLVVVGLVAFVCGLFVASTFLATATTLSEPSNKGTAEVLLASISCNPAKSEALPPSPPIQLPLPQTAAVKSDAAVLRRCVDGTNTDRCAVSSKIVVGIGTYFANHHKVVAMRDTWLRSVGQWMVLSDTFDPTIPTTQIDWRGLREQHSITASSHKLASSSEELDALHLNTITRTMAPALNMEEVQAEYNRVHPLEDTPQLREGSGTWLGRQDGDQRFLLLPLLLNDTWNTPVATEHNIRSRPPHSPSPATPHPTQPTNTFDWIFISDDDTYVFLGEALRILAHFDPSKPYILGEVKPRLSSQQDPEKFKHCFCPLDIRPKIQPGGTDEGNNATATPAPEPPVCWTLEAKERAQEYCKRNEECLKNQIDGLPIQAPATRAPRCEFAHIYGGHGLILSRGLLNLATRSHWEWCLKTFRVSIGGDWKISRCIYELGIAPTDIANTKIMGEEPNGIGWMARHWADQYHPSKIEEMSQWDEAAVEVRKWEDERKAASVARTQVQDKRIAN